MGFIKHCTSLLGIAAEAGLYLQTMYHKGKLPGSRAGRCCADTLLENLTVHEMLMYTAEMKSQTSQPWQLKAAKVCLLESHVAGSTGS